LGRLGVGGDVVPGGRETEQRAAHAASGEIGLKAAVAQLANDVGGVLLHCSHDCSVQTCQNCGCKSGCVHPYNSSVPDVFILGIESSCDETAAAVIRSGEELISNVVY